jgi:hypothetical protein
MAREYFIYLNEKEIDYIELLYQFKEEFSDMYLENNDRVYDYYGEIGFTITSYSEKTNYKKDVLDFIEYNLFFKTIQSFTLRVYYPNIEIIDGIEYQAPLEDHIFYSNLNKVCSIIYRLSNSDLLMLYYDDVWFYRLEGVLYVTKEFSDKNVFQYFDFIINNNFVVVDKNIV